MMAIVSGRNRHCPGTHRQHYHHHHQHRNSQLQYHYHNFSSQSFSLLFWQVQATRYNVTLQVRQVFLYQTSE